MAAAHMVFGDDIVTATKLNRHQSEVLDQVWEDNCITIMRNEQAFALLRRDRAAQLIADAARTELALQIVQAVLRVRAGDSLLPSEPFEWVGAFGHGDLKALAMEVYAACMKARSGEISWDDFDAIVHEWEESAWAARNPELQNALVEPADETPLSQPPGQATTE